MKELHLQSAYLGLISILLLLALNGQAYGQKTLLIVDEVGDILIGVECYNNDFSFAVVSNINGEIVVPKKFESSRVTLKYLGFQNMLVNLAKVSDVQHKIQLVTAQKLLEEVILIGRSDIRAQDFLQKIDAIQSSDITATNPQTTADAMARFADVYVQKSQMGGGSPIIRGFEANKVLLVVDGIRMNNAIYRNGHLQNAITVDNAILDQMEVIYGPSSLMYGSDALGGVVHFRTKDPQLNLSEYKKTNVFGNYYARYGSANQEKSAHFDINIGGRKWASLSSISFSDFGDLRMGSNRTKEYPEFGKRYTYQIREGNEDLTVINDRPNVHVGTAYNQLDILQKLRYQINAHMNLTANVQYSTSSNIPRYDQLVLKDGDQFEFAEWDYGPQERKLYSIKYKWSAHKPWMDEMVAIVSRQDIAETRINRNYGADTRSSNFEKVGVSALTFDIQKKISERRTHSIYYGFDINHNDVSSSAKNENILTGSTDSELFTRYPSGGSTMALIGTYAQYINQSADSSFVVHGGLRYTYFSTTVKYSPSDPISWPDFFYDGIEAENHALTWSAGANWKPYEGWTVRLLTSTAFRAPNVDDIGKLRIKNDDVTVPNTEIGPEQSLNGEINISKNFQSGLTFGGSAFYTQLSNAIVRIDHFLPGGATSFMSGNRSYNVQANVNAEEARIMGFSVNAKANLSPLLSLRTSINYIKGHVVDEEISPLAHIPPIYGKTQLNYDLGDWDFTLISIYNALKPIDQYGGSTDNPEYANEIGALGWTVFNLYGNYTLNKYTFQLGLENIFDKHYTPFASGVSGAGINAILGIRASF